VREKKDLRPEFWTRVNASKKVGERRMKVK
jgi:hypothetical protein